MSAEQMQQVAVYRLISDGVIAIKRGQSLARSSPRHVLVPLIVEQVSDIQRAAVAQNICQLPKKFVIVFNLENRTQVFWLQAKHFLYLVNAWRSRPQAAGTVGAVQNERGIQRRLRSALSFVSQEVKDFFALDRSAEIAPELIETQRVEPGRR